jgi:hypothetical protein
MTRANLRVRANERGRLFAIGGRLHVIADVL